MDLNQITQQPLLCYRCHKFEAINKSAKCEVCTLKAISSDHFGTCEHYPVLARKFLQQDQRCAYTGIKLRLGDSASLDHKIPLSKGGLNSLDNVHWVHLWINWIKRASSESVFLNEFEEFLEEIIEKGKIINLSRLETITDKIKNLT